MLAIVHEPTNEQFWQSVFSPRSDSPVSNNHEQHNLHDNHGPNERQPTILQSLGPQAREICFPPYPQKPETLNPKAPNPDVRKAKPHILNPSYTLPIGPEPSAPSLSFVAGLGEFFGVRVRLLPGLLGRVLAGQNRQQGGFPTAVGADHRHLPSLPRQTGSEG